MKTVSPTGPLRRPAPGAREEGVLEWLDRACARFPERIAVEAESVSLRYDALDAIANRVARDLIDRGIPPGSVVAVLIGDRVAMIAAMIGIFRASCVFAPLDPTGPPLRLREIVTDLSPAAFLTESGLRERVSELAGGRPVLTVDLTRRGELGRDARERERPRVSVDPDAMRYVYYTSGSTGVPKGIAGTLRSLAHFIRWEIDTFGIGEGFRVSQLIHPTFDAFFRDVLVPLCAGGTVCIPAESPGGTEPRALLDWIEHREINLIHCVPSLLQPVSPKDLGDRALGTLQYVLFAGERLRVQDVTKWLESGEGRIQVVNLYGPTECTMVKFFHFVSRSDVERGLIPIGKPLPGAGALVLGEDGKPCSPGEIGELYIRSAFLTLGYYRRPELTRQAFPPDPLGEGTDARMYKTGDLVRLLEDGTLEFIGRKDLQLKIRGVRVEPGEIEGRLLEHEGVRAAVVVGRQDRLGEQRLVAYVVPAGQPPRSTELRAFLKERLPDAMVPSSFQVLDSLPLTRTGKVDRGALPAPGPERPDLDSPFVRPRNSTEETLVSIWADLLGLANVGVEDDFFELGGNSLVAMRAVSRIRDALRVELPLRRLFESATVAKLARWIEASAPAAADLLTPPLTPARRSGRPRLSFAQLRLWFLEQLEPGNPFYNIHEAHRLSGDLDVSALTKALGAILERHEVLRTTFPAIEGVPWASIAQAGSPDLPVVDLRSLPAEQREAEILRIDQEEEQRPFDLASGPLLRMKLLRAGERDHVLMWTVHHAVFDGWSEEVFRRELSLFYSGFVSASPAPIAPLPIQYADFAEWQRGWLEGGSLLRQLAYWKKSLQGLTGTLDLPTDRPRPPQQTHRGASQTRWLPARLAESVRALSRQERVTAFMALLALFQTLLHRYTGCEDIAVGSPIAGRGVSETENLIGFFVNTLVLRTDLSGDPSFRELLRRVREVCLGAYDNPDLPFERLVEELQPERSLSHHPLFQVFVAVENEPDRPLELRGLSVRGLDTPKRTAKFDLTLSIAERPEGLRLDFRYRTDLFDAESIARMGGHFETLLEAAVTNPEQHLSELPILTSAERRQQTRWNATDADYPRDQCVHLLFEEQVRRTPEALAVVFERERLTYAETNARANQLASHLRGRGVGAGSLVGLGLERSVDLVVGLLGILKAGAAFVPLDPSLPGDRLGFMAKDAGISMLITQQRLLGRFPELGTLAVCVDAERESPFHGSSDNPVREVTARDLAYVIFTSGSTGRPKGVAIEHRSVVNLAMALERAAVSPRDSSPLRVSLNGPLAFDTSVKQILQLLEGHTLCIVPEDVRLDPEALLAWLVRQSIHVFDCTPSQLRPLLAAGLLERPGLSLRQVLVAGEPIDAETWGILARSEQIRFFNLYGPTECTVDAALCEIRPGLGRPVIGRPVANTQIHILDRYRQHVPVGVTGELWIGGEGVARGYWRRPELTAERFLPDPFRTVEGSRLYRTGDLGRFLADGDIELVGRADQQIKFRGFRIELEEIGAVLAEHPAVESAVVLLREDASVKRLVAYAVPETGSLIRHDDLRAFAKQRLPEYMVPSAFVMLAALPLTSNGKVDRSALPPPDSADSGEPPGFVAPRTPLEETLAGIWAGLLGVQRVGVHDNFFDLGGHSLLAVQVLSRVRDSVGVELPVRALFAGPSVAEMAVAVAQSQARRLRADELERLLSEVESALPPNVDE